MRSIVSILLIVVLAVQMTGSYWISAAFYLNRDFIAANWCINRFDRIPVCKGSCYLQHQQEENGKKQEKASDSRSSEIALFHPAASCRLETPFAEPLATKYLIANASMRAFLLPNPIFRPPCQGC